MADPMTDEVFAKVEITQLFGENRDTLPKPPRPYMQHMIYPLAKPIHEHADLQQLSLTRSFLGMCSASDQFTTFKVIDFAEKNWTFKLMFRSEHQDYLMTDDWASFVREKSVQVGDVVVFLIDLISDKTRFTIRRGSVSVGRRHYLNLEAFSKAVGSLS
ncbi:B3 DNA binding domain [Arabidopsis thaliana x Arabidopsis arenosa]|uniref:B3 DNA binding domain n=2 Tax=Arabidopsis TaxID=3701 RepID=A0A8T1ZKP3_9BRAS|nr:B3 DNA binding domain [Arabidopsis thaliana x Arabidopsis arenosa]